MCVLGGGGGWGVMGDGLDGDRHSTDASSVSYGLKFLAIY